MCFEFSLLLLLVYMLLCDSVTCEDHKSSLTFVIDDTGSMKGEILQVKRKTEEIFDAVLKSRESQIENFILVTFNDPDVKLRTITRDANVFKDALSKINVNGGGLCPEYSMTGIELALKESLPGSYLYVFTDASADDYQIYDRVKSLAQRKSCQVVFVLTGKCDENFDSPKYKVYTSLAKVTGGQIFHMGKTEIGIIIRYVLESIKGRRNNIATNEFGPGYGHNFTFSVDTASHDVIVAVSGDTPELVIKDELGFAPNTERLVDMKSTAILKLPENATGDYTAKVGSRTNTSVVVSARTELNFDYGFSTLKPMSINETASKPMPDVESFLMIKLLVNNDARVIVNLKTVKIVNEDETLYRELPLKLVNEERKLYITEAFEIPKTMFKMTVIGIDLNTNTTVSRTAQTMIEPQNPAIELKENKGPVIHVEGEPKVDAEFNEPFTLKCMVIAYPKPNIFWMDKDTGVTLPAMVSDVELPYKYISIFKIEKVSNNKTYECIASNDYGDAAKSIQIETKQKSYFISLEVPKDVQIQYNTNQIIPCKIDAFPPAAVTWYRENTIIDTDTNFTIVNDGSEIIIHNMRPSQTGHYTCVAKNEFITYAFNFDVDINGVESPKIDKHVREMTVVSGTDVTILCSVIKGIPKPTISWHHQRIFTDKLIKLSNTEDKLHIKNIKDNRSGLYRCQAVNIIGVDTHDINLVVHYPAKVKYDTEIVEVKEGEEITLSCAVEGLPTPSVQWYKDETPVIIAPPMLLFRDHSLRFEASIKETGLYSCVAENYLGVAKKSIQLYVYAPITIKSPEESIINLMVGNNVDLPCLASGFPKPIIRWIHYSNSPTIPPRTLRARGNTLSLSHVQQDDAGYYTCSASNIQTSYNISYEIIVLAPPQIENIYVDKTFKVVEGDASLKIECKVTGSPTPVRTWKKDGQNIIFDNEWYEEDANGALIIKTIITQIAGSYICEAVNKFGRDAEVYSVEVSLYPKQEWTQTTQLVEVGTTAYIKCNIPHGPNDHLRWYKDSRLVRAGKLKLRDVTLSDAGIFTCRANTASGPVSSSTSVKVGYKPKFTTVEDEIYYLDDSSWTQVFVCDADAEPSAKVSWWHNDKQINVTEMIYIFHAEFNKRGKYFCEISNDFGTIRRNFYLESTDCIIDMKKDLTGNQPIILDSFFKWPQLKTIAGYIRIQKDEDHVKLYCPSEFINYPYKNIAPYCINGTDFSVKGNIYKYSDLKCKEEIEPRVVKTGKSCFSGSTELISVGFDVSGEYLSVFNVCMDLWNEVPIYAKHSLNRFIAEVEPDSQNWRTGHLPFDFEEIYNCDNQTSRISEALNKWFPVESSCCFAKRQLVNARDVLPGVAQTATYTYLNVVPHWSSCGTQNWDEVENRLRTLVKTIGYSLTVWTGTSEMLELPNHASSMTQIYVRDSTTASQPVSQYLWKVVQDPVTKSSLVIVQINIPDLTTDEVIKHVLCKDICHHAQWMKNADWHNTGKGYTYCCSLGEFERKFKINGIFDRHYKIFSDVSKFSEHSLG